MRVLLVDDHPLFLDGLRSLLLARGVDVVGTARDGLEALEQARSLRPDLIIMDVVMPRVDGIAGLRLIKAEFPCMKIVMLTMSDGDEQLFEAIKAGASGYLLKTQDTPGFFKLLDEAAQGEAALSPGIAGRLLREFRNQADGVKQQSAPTRGTLSPREIQVLTLVAQGLTYKEVGAKLFLSERTIKYHMGEIVARLQLQSRAEVLEYARRTGLVR
jgi:DNA-binding NarL/FixJ family response regulator